MQLISNTISNLKKQIGKGNTEAIPEFINNIKKSGTPLIEELDEAHSLVTYIYLGDENTKNVILVPDGDGWDKPDENAMERIEGTDIFYLTAKMPNDVMFDFRFSINDNYGDDYDNRWENSIHDIYCTNKLGMKDEDGNVVKVRGSYVIMKNAPRLYYTLDKDIPNKGSIEKREVESKILKNKRNIYFYMPYNYSSKANPYKVLVLMDGSDYLNILNAKNVLDNLIYEEKIPPIAAVFITQTEERNNELACNDEFVSFVINEVMPFAREHYNLSIKLEDNIIGGLSLGGLIAMYMELKHSDVFGNVLSQSGAFWWSSYNLDGKGEIRNYLVEEFEKVNKLPLKVYMETGELEDRRFIISPNEQLRDLFLKKGYNVKYSTFKAGHDYLLWGETLGDGLEWLLETT